MALMSDVRRGREQQVMITLLYDREDDKQLSERDIHQTLQQIINLLNCRKDVVICERRTKGRGGIFVKAYKDD